MKYKIVLFLFSALLIGCKEKKQKAMPIEGSDKKNVVFILVDDLGWKDLGCYGSEFYETPNIDRLASKGTLFTNAYSANPVCSPTRAAIMTGKHPSRVGITDWLQGHDPKDRELLGPQDLTEMPLQEVTIAEVLKDEGYKTFFAGKWHLGDTGFFPEDQGFDINKGGHHMGQPPGGYYSPYDNPKLTDGPEGEYLTDRLTNESIQFLEEHGNRPFYLNLSYYTVHTPIQASKKHLAKFQKKRRTLTDMIPIKDQEGPGNTIVKQYNAEYASMVYALDENVGRLLDKLEALNLMDNTLIIFTSDNGGLTTTEKEYNPPTSVRPLRAGKGWAYEGGIRIPLIIKRPNENKNNTVDGSTVSMDMFPTILDGVEISLRPELHIDGKSLIPILGGTEKEVHDVLFWDYPHYHTSGWTPGLALRKGDWKLIYFYEGNKYELYNLKEDIAERNDLSKSNSKKLEELKSELNSMRQKLNTVSPSLNNK